VFSVLGGWSVRTAHYGETLEVHFTFLLRPLETCSRQEWTAEWRNERDVINWTKYQLSNLTFTLNSVMCKIYKVKFQLLDSIHKYTYQVDTADVIKHRQKIFVLKLQSYSNLVIKHLCSVNPLTAYIVSGSLFISFSLFIATVFFNE